MPADTLSLLEVISGDSRNLGMSSSVSEMEACQVLIEDYRVDSSPTGSRPGVELGVYYHPFFLISITILKIIK